MTAIKRLLVIGGILAVLGISESAFAAPMPGKLQGDHGNRSVMPKSCRACHRGMAMKIAGEEKVCLACHGGTAERGEMVRQGFLLPGLGTELRDLEAELRKPYNHPVLTGRGVHRPLEALPEEVASAPRHAECVDCHAPHVVEKGKPFKGIAGKRVGNFIADMDQEYELCFRCHAESANLPGTSTNKFAEFKATNPSFHPILDEGRSTFVISLKEPYVARKERPGEISIISCRDCHGSDDPKAPKGPHGSLYRGLLRLNYEMEDGRPESEYAYGLCYTCHNRSSILGNESFPQHARHIEGNRAGNQPGTSCFTCHDAHGSTRYPSLIRFNEDVVRPTIEGKLEFKPQGVASRHGSCQLNCHGAEHNPRVY